MVFYPPEGNPLSESKLNFMSAPYQSPATVRTIVETEGSFCGSVFNPEGQKHNGVTIDEHGFASEHNPDGSMPEWEVDLGKENWDK